MSRQGVFDILFGLLMVYALWQGGKPERSCALAFLAADILSVAVLPVRSIRFRHEELGVLVVDVALLGFLVWLALRSTRWWPLVTAGLQLDGVVVHAMRLTVPEILPVTYQEGTALWSYPMALLLGMATWRHRCRLRHFGEDPSWKGSATSAAEQIADCRIGSAPRSPIGPRPGRDPAGRRPEHG